MIKKIIHVSDVHIRVLKRHDEYKKVFEDFYKIIDGIDDSVVVCTGDILHSKLELSAELVEMVKDFVLNISRRTRLIIIPGNHDLLLNNLSRLEPMQTLIDAFNAKNVIYANKPRLIEMDNVVFSVMPVTHSFEDYIKASDIKNIKTKVALFHGMIKHSYLDNHLLADQGVDRDFFDGFDMVLLGDIHLSQKIQNYDPVRKKPCMAYAGSLIQQNYRESLEHGFLLWDVENRDYDFVKIDNDYSFFVIDFINNEPSSYPELTKCPRIKIRHKNSSREKINQFIENLSLNYEISDLVIEDANENLQINFNGMVADVESLRDHSFQNLMIKEYCVENGIEDYEELIKLNEKINLSLKQDDQYSQAKGVWTVNSMKFSNVFSYGSDNFINFDSLKGIIGLFSPNYSGKSSIFNALAFAIYDKCDKTNKADDVLNIAEAEFYIKLELTLSGKKYYIDRRGKKEKEKVKSKVFFYSEDKDLSEEYKKTNSIIRKHFGEYDDYELTTYSPQNSRQNFIDKTQSERKDLFIKVLGLDIFDKLNDEIEKEYKLSLSYVKKFDKKLMMEEIQNKSEKISVLELEINEIQNLIDANNAKIESLEEEIDNLHKKIRRVEITHGNVETFQMKIEYFVKEAENKKRRKEELQNEIKIKKMERVNDEIAEVDFWLRNNVGVGKKHSELERKRDACLLQLNELKSKSEKLLKLEYDPNCKYCMNNIFVIEAQEAKRKISEKEKELEIIDGQFKEIESLKKQHDEKNDELRRLLNIKAFYDKIKDEINQIDKWLIDAAHEKKEAERQIELIKKNIETIEKNREIENSIQKLKKERDALKHENQKLFVKRDSLKENKTKLVVELENKKKEIEELVMRENIVKKYGLYYELTKRDGIPYYILKKNIHIVQNFCNNILKEITDFTLEFALDGQNLEVYICREHGKWNLNLSSGMEKFISSVVIRIALIKVSGCVKSDFMIIDEGWSQIDNENIMAMERFFQFLRENFKFVILISHNNYIKDMVDRVITISKDERNRSYINIF